MKNLLLHVGDEATLDQRLDSALAVARAFNGHIRCLQVTPLDAYVAMDGLGGMFVMGDLLKAVDQQESTLRSRIEERLSREGVSWDFQHSTGAVAAALSSFAALSDLLVTSRPAPKADRPTPAGNVSDIVENVRTPVLTTARDGSTYDPLAPVVVAWNRSFEAASAIKSTLPLLRQSRAVHVVTVSDPREERPDFPGTLVLEYLSRHSVHAELHDVEAPRSEVTAQLLSTVARTGAGSLVMGAYGHSRLGEFWFGGVTRTMLDDCPVALVTAR